MSRKKKTPTRDELTETYVANMDALKGYIDHLRINGTRTYKGEVPLPDGTRAPIDIAFERTDRKPSYDGGSDG